MSKHAVDTLITDPNIVSRAYGAMITARATGSVGATEIHEVNGLSESTTVVRITTGLGEKIVGSAAFRVVGLGNDAVIVATSAKATSHAIDGLSQALIDEDAEEVAELHEYDEDYYRADEV